MSLISRPALTGQAKAQIVLAEEGSIGVLKGFGLVRIQPRDQRKGFAGNWALKVT